MIYDICILNQKILKLILQILYILVLCVLAIKF